MNAYSARRRIARDATHRPRPSINLAAGGRMRAHEKQRRNMSDSELFPLQVGNEIIQCQTVDDRQLLEEAQIVLADGKEATGFTLARINKMIDACAFYKLTTMQRHLVPFAEKASDE
jgi:hypothetical protein